MASYLYNSLKRIVVGEEDGLARVRPARDRALVAGRQRELFERLGTTDKIWTVLPESDHAAHILQRRHMFVRSVVGFITRANGPMEQWAVSSPPIDDGPADSSASASSGFA